MDYCGLLFEAIFEHALDLAPGGEREAYIAEVAAGDPDLLDRIVAFIVVEDPSCAPASLAVATGTIAAGLAIVPAAPEFMLPLFAGPRDIIPGDFIPAPIASDLENPPERLRSA